MSAAHQMMNLRDPLTTFDWQTLGCRYENLCHKFDQNSPYIEFITPKPVSDRELYRVLVRRFSEDIGSNSGVSFETYLAMLYWKLYSQRAAIVRTCQFLVNHIEARRAATEGLKQLSNHLQRIKPEQLADVIALLRDHSRFRFRGMADRTALPVRTTFLHFTSPNAIPIFDKQVLLAVGVSEKYANQKLEYLQLYFPHALALGSRYERFFSPADTESTLRLIDMALWVTRSSLDERKAECRNTSAP